MYNSSEAATRPHASKGRPMTRVVTTIRCVPRVGLHFTEVRTVELEVPAGIDETGLHRALNLWFAQHGVEEAVYAIDVDDHGYFAVINDEAYRMPWGRPHDL